MTEQTLDVFPIARILVDADGYATGAIMYAPSLPEGQHDLWPIPVEAETELASLRARIAELEAREQWYIARLESGGPGLDGYRELGDKCAELEAERDRYYELLYAVEKKHPGETRHETALRYIREAEAHTGDPGQSTREEALR